MLSDYLLWKELLLLKEKQDDVLKFDLIFAFRFGVALMSSFQDKLTCT